MYILSSNKPMIALAISTHLVVIGARMQLGCHRKLLRAKQEVLAIGLEVVAGAVKRGVVWHSDVGTTTGRCVFTFPPTCFTLAGNIQQLLYLLLN